MSGVIKDIYFNINRTLQVSLSSAVLRLLMLSEPNHFILLVYLVFAIMVFYHLEFAIFQDVSAIMLVTLLFQILNAFNTGLPLGVVIVNDSVIFLFLQTTIELLKISFFGQIMSNAQFLLAGLIVQVMRSSISDDYVIVIILVVVVMLFNILGYESSDLCALYTMATITVVQQSIISSIPVVFLLPSLVMLVYILDMAVFGLKSVETLSGFIVYNGAVVLRSSLQSMFSRDVAFFCASMVTCAVYFLHMSKMFQLGKTLCLLQAVDFTMFAVSGMYQNDPVLCLVLTLFVVRMLLS